MDKSEFTNLVLDDYQKRMMYKAAQKPTYKPWHGKDRDIIEKNIKEVLAFRENLIPDIKILSENVLTFDGYSIKTVLFESWKNCYGSANIYIPNNISGKLPVVLVCCGHGSHGRLTPMYQAMARRLVLLGCVVVMSDNLGQGERKFMGHVKCVMPFYCGLTTQGMIVSEAYGWLNTIKKFSFTDTERIGVCGNSGGGTLSMYLGALHPSVAATASTGYPSSFLWIGSKEKLHCHCNMSPNVLSKLEMCDVYSLIAPKPLYMLQGYNDEYFPSDLFFRNARRVKLTYEKMKADNNYTYEIIDGPHSWQNESRKRIAAFFAKCFGLPFADDSANDLSEILPPDGKYVSFPDYALTTDLLAQSITDIHSEKELKLWDIFVPNYNNEKITSDKVLQSADRGDVMQILAQFQCFL